MKFLILQIYCKTKR